MIKNYFLTALRHFTRHKAYSLINICGLATGIAACMIIFLVVRYENSYDRFQPDFERIAHVVTMDTRADDIDYTAGIQYPALEALRTDFPNLKFGCLYATFGSQVTLPSELEGGVPKKFIEERGVYFMDPQFFEVFRYQWLTGSAAVLAVPGNAIISRSMAEKYFGDWKKAEGKLIRLDNSTDLKIAGVLEDTPQHSDFPILLAGSYETFKKSTYYSYTTDWGSTTSNFQVYSLLPQNVSFEQINKQLEGFAGRHYKTDGRRKNFLHPLSENHFDTRFGNLGDHIISHPVLATLSLVGVLIILMACINFVNLATAQAVNRSKEIGVRKVMGSNRIQLFGQMMGETALLVFIAGMLAIIIAWVCLPPLLSILSIQEPLAVISGPDLLLLLTVLISCAVLAGFYPAIVLSGFEPVTALKTRFSARKSGGLSLRRALVVLQFTISQALIIGTIVAITQMEYVRKADLGFNKEAVMVLGANKDSVSMSRLKPFKNELLRIPGVKMVSLNSDAPSSDNNWGTNFAFDHKDDEKFILYLKFADADYFKTFDLKFLAGEPYQTGDTTTGVVINETLMKQLGITQASEVLGKELRLGGGRWKSIVGVVKDFKTNSLKEDVKPVMIAAKGHYHDRVAIKLHSSNIAQTKMEIEKRWQEFFPEYAFYSFFVDEAIERFYEQENRLAFLFKIFAGLAVFISCLGLYGLVSFMVVQKTREVGIRKVLGAGVRNIIFLFSKEFTVLIAVAFIIACPLAYYFMMGWLENFVFRIELGIWIFLVAAAGSLLVAWFAVGYKAIKAALTNPVKSLRTE